VSEQEQLIELLCNRTISISEFSAYFKKGTFSVSNFVLAKFETALNHKDAVQIEFLVIVAKMDGLSKKYSAIFCELLPLGWHYKHEDIIMALDDIKDPDTVECIFNTAIKKYEYLDYDENYSLAKNVFGHLLRLAISMQYKK
jgi:hypothetical protein